MKVTLTEDQVVTIEHAITETLETNPIKSMYHDFGPMLLQAVHNCFTTYEDFAPVYFDARQIIPAQRRRLIDFTHGWIHRQN